MTAGGMVPPPTKGKRSMNNEINELNMTELDTVSGGCGGCAGGNLMFEAAKRMLSNEGFNGNAFNQGKPTGKIT